jgi:hypothetical protein
MRRKRDYGDTLHITLLAFAYSAAANPATRTRATSTAAAQRDSAGVRPIQPQIISYFTHGRS